MWLGNVSACGQWLGLKIMVSSHLQNGPLYLAMTSDLCIYGYVSVCVSVYMCSHIPQQTPHSHTREFRDSHYL